MNDIAVMYHYVRKENGWKGIHPLDPINFEKQIDLLSKKFDFVSPEDLGRMGKRPKCVLTFDDGTKDQYTIAFETLRRKGIPGYFTVMSGPLNNRQIPIFHLVHMVLSLYSDEEIWTDLNDEFELKDIDTISNYYFYEKNLLRRYNKYSLNFYLNEKQSRPFLEDRIVSKYGSAEKFIKDFYISKKEFIDIKNSGMTIGVHCVNHIQYTGKPNDFYNKEIKPCADYIKQEIGVDPKWYTPAFGGGEKYKEMISDLEGILKSNGYKGGFTTIKGLNDGNLNFWLNRYDCIDLPPISNNNIFL